MAQLFKPNRIHKNSFVNLLAMMASIEHFYHQGLSYDLKTYLADPVNLLNIDLACKEERDRCSPLVVAILQLKNAVEKLSTIVVYHNHLGDGIYLDDIHASEVGKQQAFRMLAELCAKKLSEPNPARYGLVNELVLEVKGDHLPEMINQFKLLKSEVERATYLVTLANRPETPGHSPK